MKSPLAVLLVALVGATACVDSVTAPSDLTPRTATVASNPPPPPVTGLLTGAFSVPLGTDAAVAPGSVAATATALHHGFNQDAIYNKDLLTGISSLQMRNRLAIWVSDAGASVGHGEIREIDPNGDLWTIDLTQIHSATGGQLLTCESDVTHNQYCVQIAQPIVATVQRFHGLDAIGNPVYDAPLHSAASTLAFRWTLAVIP